MTNLTSLFKKYVDIIEEENQVDQKLQIGNVEKKKKSEVEQYSLKDSFVKECYDLFAFIKELRKVLIKIAPEYEKDDFNMTEAEKDEFDTEFRLQFQQYVQKFKQLEKYEQDRQKIIGQRFISEDAGVMNQFFKSGDKESIANFHRTNNRFRLGVLQSLNLWINTVSSQFTSMQQDRLITQKKFELLDFNAGVHSPPTFSKDPLTNIDGKELEKTLSISILDNLKNDPVHDEVKRYEETVSKLTQEQLQLLETEHEELLNQKNEQLQNIEKINKTIMDIVSIQSELSTHLQSQSQNINTMLDNQEEVEINIIQGNKQLDRAKKSASRSAKMIKYIAILMGILILILDFVS